MKLRDVLDRVELDKALSAGHVRASTHPSLPMEILNYTEKAQYERAWNPITRQCRGLIVNSSTGDIVARPFSKFFNYGEPEVGDLDPDEPVAVTDKADGSLGILYPTPTGWAVATRGSFTSEQAFHATDLFRTRYGDFEPRRGLTYLFEIIYPGNRIVLDYGDTNDLIHLGVVHIETGRSSIPDLDWPGRAVERFPYLSLAEALTAKPRPNAEGLVVHFRYSDQRVKIKQDDYVQLHRIITGLNERVVWERLGSGETVAAICEPLPDEFHSWVRGIAARLCTQRDRILAAASVEHGTILRNLPQGWLRKDYAMQAKSSQHRAVLFQMLDGRDPNPSVWRSLRPSGVVSMTKYGEDVA